MSISCIINVSIIHIYWTTLYNSAVNFLQRFKQGSQDGGTYLKVLRFTVEWNFLRNPQWYFYVRWSEGWRKRPNDLCSSIPCCMHFTSKSEVTRIRGILKYVCYIHSRQQSGPKTLKEACVRFFTVHWAGVLRLISVSLKMHCMRFQRSLIKKKLNEYMRNVLDNWVQEKKYRR